MGAWPSGQLSLIFPQYAYSQNINSFFGTFPNFPKTLFALFMLNLANMNVSQGQDGGKQSSKRQIISRCSVG